MAHTSCPWAVSKTVSTVVHGIKKYTIVGTAPHNCCYPIAECQFIESIDKGEVTANARLIAAAPEMLYALKKALLQFGDIVGSPENPDDLETINLIKNVISKATN